MRYAIAFTLVVIVSATAAGQAPAGTPSCVEPSPADYAHCALWLEPARLRRGMHAETITRPGFFSPMRLTENVSGDSARHYARAYESNLRTAYRWQIAGIILTVAGFVYASSYECDPDPTFGFCTRTDDDYYIPASGMILAGTVANFVSLPFAIRGNRFAAKAVFWHNARFARP